MRYELGDVLETTDDRLLASTYHTFIQRYSDPEKAKELFEKLAILPKEVLKQLRLEYRPRREGFYAAFYIIQSNREVSNYDYVLVKQHDYSPMRYIAR